MKEYIKELNPVALYCVCEEFRDDKEEERKESIVAIYGLKNNVGLIEVIPHIKEEDINKVYEYKYNGIFVITMRISRTEYEYYLRLYDGRNYMKSSI